MAITCKRCKFGDAEETDELLNEKKIIAGTRNPELQKQLLSNGETLTLQEHLNRNYEASLNQTKRLSEIKVWYNQKNCPIRH